MVNAPTAHHTTSHKRRRGAEMKGSEDAAADAAAEKRRAVWDQITRDLAVVLKEHDTHPSVLTATIPPPDSTSTAAGSSSSSSSDGTPPIKRARLSSNPPTIAERLAAGTYTTPTALLSDIAAVCRTLDAPSATAPFHDLAHTLVTRECARRPDLFHGAHLPPAAAATAAHDRDKLALMVMAHHGPLFSSLQTAIATVAPAPSAERLSRSPSASGSSPTASTAPTSTCASPRTAPTSIVRVVAPLNEAALPPLISTVKAASNPLKRGAAAVAAAAAEKVPTLAEAFPPVRISSLAPPKAGALGVVGLKWGGVMGPGGVAVVNGGASARPEPAGEWLLYRNHPPRTAKWRALARGEPVRQGMGLPAEVVAAYSSFAPVRDDAGAKVPAGVRGRVWWERVGREVFREAFEGHPGVGHMFREKEDEEEAVAAAAAKGSNADVEMGEAAADGGDDEEEQFRKAVESWEPDEDVPVDFRLLEGAEEGVVARKEKKEEKKEGEGKEDEEEEEDEDEEEEEVAGVNADETLKEISNLLKRLQSHQYIRLSTAPAPPAPRITTTSTTGSAPAAAAAATTDTSTDTPTAEELTLYNDIHTRLAHLIASLPPHATASADGTPTAPLAISPLHPLATGTPIYTGTLPSTPPAPPAAALAALNAAVGMSPSSTSPAPIALMTRASATAPPRLQGAPNVQTYYTPPPPPQQQQQYHGHQLPAATMPHHYPSPYAPPPPRVVSPGVSRVAQQQPMFHAHSMPPAATAGAAAGAAVARRVNVPPPMGLAAIGAGYGGGGGGGGGGYVGQRGAGVVVAGAVGADALRMGVQHTQASMENGTVPGGRYAGRSRR